MADRPRIALCYDFDKTLSPDDMQTYAFIPSLGMQPDDFWKKANAMAQPNHMEKNLAWMKLMIDESHRTRQSVSRDSFVAQGAHVQFFRGLDTWFDRVNAYAAVHGLEAQHYIISSGLKETIEGTAIARYFARIYASSYMYDENNLAVWPAQAVNYTNKTQFLFRIAKGAFDENDERVNQSMKDEALYIPYENMIYIGDSQTDIPCMRVVKNKGGIAIGVYDPESDYREKVYSLFNDRRINYFAPADYSAGQPLSETVRLIIDMMAAREALRAQSKRLGRLVAPYSAYRAMYDNFSARGKLGEPAVIQMLERMRAQIEGNID